MQITKWDVSLTFQNPPKFSIANANKFDGSIDPKQKFEEIH